jgi:hypothetical protein
MRRAIALVLFLGSTLAAQSNSGWGNPPPAAIASLGYTMPQAFLHAAPGQIVSVIVYGLAYRQAVPFVAAGMVRDERSLAVAGILSAQGQCSRCRRLLAELFQDPEDRLPELLERWVTLIRNRLAPKSKPHLIVHRPRSVPDKTHD